MGLLNSSRSNPNAVPLHDFRKILKHPAINRLLDAPDMLCAANQPDSIGLSRIIRPSAPDLHQRNEILQSSILRPSAPRESVQQLQIVPRMCLLKETMALAPAPRAVDLQHRTRPSRGPRVMLSILSSTPQQVSRSMYLAVRSPTSHLINQSHLTCLAPVHRNHFLLSVLQNPRSESQGCNL